jgi:hypothetical protein
MNAAEHSEVLQETDHVQEDRANPSVHSELREHCSGRQTPPWNPVGPCVPDEDTSETFVGGAGI